MYWLSQVYVLKPPWNSLKLHKDVLKKNCRNPGDTQGCFNVYKLSKRRRLTLINTRSYDDKFVSVTGVCWHVPKMPSHAVIICFVQAQFNSFWHVYYICWLQLPCWLLVSTEISLRYFKTIKNQLFKKMFFYITKFMVLSTVMFKNFFGKNWCVERLEHVCSSFTIF